MFTDTFLYFVAFIFEITFFAALYIFFRSNSKKLFWLFLAGVSMSLSVLSLFGVEENILASEKIVLTYGAIFIANIVVLHWKFINFLDGDGEKCQK